MIKNLSSSVWPARPSSGCGTLGSLAAVVAAIALILAPAAHAEEPARFSGSAALTLPRAQASDDQRYAITAALLPRASSKSTQSNAGGRFELNAKLTAHANSKGLVTCGPIDPLIFRDGFE